MTSFDEQWQRWFPEKEPAHPPVREKSLSRILLPVIGGIIILFILLSVGKTIYTEWLWFSSLGYSSVYATILRTKLVLFFIVAFIVFIYFLANLILAARFSPNLNEQFAHRIFMWVAIPLSALLGVIFGLVALGKWQEVLMFLNGQPFGITDPVFNREVAFYVYSLPFFHWLHSWLLALTILTFIGTGVVYVFSYVTQGLRSTITRQVTAHLAALVIAVLCLFAWGYWLHIWELVFSDRGAVYGAGYADIYASLPAQWILFAVVFVCIFLIIFSVQQRKWRWAAYGIGGWVVAAIIVGAIFPAVVQRFQVQPNELALERPYLEHNIEFTREAFALNRVEERSFPAEKTPTLQDIEDNEVTINNIRLWDHRPLKDTYNQIQSIRLYYDFNDVDIDRYNIDGMYRQVMLSPRELSAEKLAGQAQTWVNRQLQFTHGYGVVMSPVNEITKEGLPVLLMKDIPPSGVFTIDRPQIYFGEKTNHYVIVKTKTQEFDYPMGESNVYGHWEGSGGVNIGSFMRRFIYAWEFGEFNILISDEITPQSELLYHRSVSERVTHLAPFLKLDSDPYMVIVDGKLYWIQDCYTTTEHYPYSTPLKSGVNYIRNSVKAVIDAYDGSTTFYVADSEDALIKTYQAIFPGLFVPMKQIPESLRIHLRYPEDMFRIQSSVYQAYHMKDARVFYNKEDLWAIPREIYAGNEQSIEPYYIIMRLPDGDKEEFLLMFPFTPVNKNNTIGWLAARCDGENYGKLLAYNFPKDRLVYGPSQIENRIQQDTVITEQLALWSRGGSKVIRGNLLMIPIGKSNLYVEPVFLQAESGGLPELKRVIVATGERLAMRPTLAESTAAIFSEEEPQATAGPSSPAEPAVEPPEVQPVPAPTSLPAATNIAGLVEKAQQHYDAAQQFLKEGDWAGYGKELAALKEVLNQLQQLAVDETN